MAAPIGSDWPRHVNSNFPVIELLLGHTDTKTFDEIDIVGRRALPCGMGGDRNVSDFATLV